MRERVVVGFRGVPPSRTGGEPPYLPRALALKKHADALGATLCAWSAEAFGFSFGADELDEAISLALRGTEENVPPEHRFGIGVAQGPMDRLGDGPLSMLAWGPPLLTASALARAAYPGEVLVDPALPAARAGEVLTTGARITADGGVRVRGLRLDLAEPWRKDAARNVSRLVEPPLIGCDGVFEELAVPLGCLGVVRADAGAGGSRLLAEWTDRLAPWRVLLITPVGTAREPLGAIRCALSRSAALHAAPPLPEHLRGVLDRLLTGEGADLWSVAELLDAWLGSAEGRSGVLAVDDANDIDLASLEAVANSISVRGRFRMLARVEANAPLPEPFVGIPAGPALVIGPLARENAERLGAAFTGGAIAEEALTRWARRGGATPLAIREAIAEGLTSGELSWAGDIAVPRRRAAGRGRTAGAHEWIARRVRRIAPEQRAMLTALAILGGDVSDAMVDDLAGAMHGAPLRIAGMVGALTAASWVVRPEPGWTKLRSRTARDAFVGLLDPTTRRKWHEAAARTLEQHGGLLSRADAAWHASQGGDPSGAARLAMQAAAAATSAALELAAGVLVSFARAQDPEVVDSSVVRRAREEREIARARSETPPPELVPELEIEDEVTQDLSFLSDGPSSRLDGRRREGRVLALDFVSEPEDSNLMTRESPGLGPSKVVELAKEALVQGDLATLEALLVELRISGAHAELVERMSGIVALGRGSKVEALQRLHAAAHTDQVPAQRARALLAYGVALAATGRPENALLEALAALSQARAAQDLHGEHACARFLARLCSAAGHQGAANVWEDEARKAGEARAS